MSPTTDRPQLAVGGPDLTVTNTQNSGPGSLRDVLTFAATNFSADVILFDIAPNSPGCVGSTCTITLTSPIVMSSEEPVTIDGGTNTIAISGNGTSRLFEINGLGEVTLRKLELRNGVETADDAPGGCITTISPLLLDSLNIHDCQARVGGAIYNLSSLTITNSDIHHNGAASGGAIANRFILSIDRTNIHHNATSGDGALVNNGGSLTMTRSSVTDNVGGSVAGVQLNFTQARIANSTISRNASTIAGGAAFEANNSNAVSIVNSTLVREASPTAVALRVGGQYAGVANISGSIVDGPCSSNAGTLLDQGYNRASDASCVLTAATSGPLLAGTLGALADNGGGTLTHALLAGSTAINAIPVGQAGCTTTDTDQRGTTYARLVGAACDIGAFEVQAPKPAFGGFLSPVRDGVVNRLTAGRVLPVNFSLGGNFGLTPFATGYPAVTIVPCPARSVARYTISTSSTTTGAKSSKLNYDATTGQYTYLWATDKTWAGTCRQLTFRFTGVNTDYAVVVEFTK